MVQRVQPVYTQAAMAAGIEGDLRLTACGASRRHLRPDQKSPSRSTPTPMRAGLTVMVACGGDGTAPVVRRIGNRFPPPPLFLHEPGRFQGTQGESSRLDGCRQTVAFERVRPQTTRRQSLTETPSNGFDSRRHAAASRCRGARVLTRCRVARGEGTGRGVERRCRLGGAAAGLAPAAAPDRRRVGPRRRAVPARG